MFYFSLWRDSPSWLLTMATGVSFQKCHATLSSCRLTHSCLTSSLCPLWQPFQAYAVYFWCQAGPGRLKGNLNPLNNKHHTPLGDKRWFEKIFAYMCISNLRRGAGASARTGLCVQRGRQTHGCEASQESKQSMAEPRQQLSITTSCNSQGMMRNNGPKRRRCKARCCLCKTHAERGEGSGKGSVWGIGDKTCQELLKEHPGETARAGFISA